MRRRSLPCHSSIARGKDVVDVGRRDLSVAYIHQRTYDRAHHSVEKPVGDDPKYPVTFAFLGMPCRFRHGTDAISRVGTGSTEGTEVVLAYKTTGSLVHIGKIRRTAHEPSRRGLERPRLQRHAVFVRPLDRAVAGMKLPGNLFDLNDSYSTWQKTVQGSPKFP